MLTEVFPDNLTVFSDKIFVTEKMHKQWRQLLKEMHFLSSPETESCSEITTPFPVLCVALATLRNTASIF